METAWPFTKRTYSAFGQWSCKIGKPKSNGLRICSEGGCICLRLSCGHRRFQLQKRSQYFIGVHHETFPVAARCTLAIQIVRPRNQIAETQPKLQPASWRWLRLFPNTSRGWILFLFRSKRQQQNWVDLDNHQRRWPLLSAGCGSVSLFDCLSVAHVLALLMVEGDYAYILWTADTADNVYEVATDTFVIRQDKIMAQSFSAKIMPKG